MATGIIKTGQVELGTPPTLPQHAVRLQDVTEVIRAMVSEQAAGTAYTLTAVPAKIVFGTTSPAIALATDGTYLFFCRALFNLVGATFAANQIVTFTLRRTNNTLADIFTTSVKLPIMMTETHDFEVTLPVLPYTTINGDDTFELWASLDVLPSVGSVTVSEASILAK